MYNFIHTIEKSEIELYRSKEYKSEFRWNAFICIKNNTDIAIKYKNTHNHREDHVSTIQEESRKEIKNEIKKSKDPFSINLPKLVKSISVD